MSKCNTTLTLTIYDRTSPNTIEIALKGRTERQTDVSETKTDSWKQLEGISSVSKQYRQLLAKAYFLYRVGTVLC